MLATSVRFLEELENRGGPDRELEGVLDSLECPCEAIVDIVKIIAEVDIVGGSKNARPPGKRQTRIRIMGTIIWVGGRSEQFFEPYHIAYPVANEFSTTTKFNTTKSLLN